MEIIVDGIIYQIQARGGISRIFNEILPRMCQIDKNLNIRLLMSGQSQQQLPQHSRIHVKQVPYIGRFLKVFHRLRCITNPLSTLSWRFSTGNTKGKIWHSTYFTMPGMWKGKTVVSVHDMIYELFPALFNTLNDERFRKQKKSCILSADVVLCGSENTRSDVQELYNISPDKLWVVPNAYSHVFLQIPASNYVNEPPIPTPFILFVGSRARYKNFTQLLQVYSRWKHMVDVCMVVVGKEWSPNEKELLVSLNILDRVHLLNKVDDETLCHLYNTAAAFVYPSLYEGFGIPLLEAMACGCPIIASRIPSTVEVAGECPIYFKPSETDDLMLALDRALSEGRDSPRSLAGLEHVKNFSWEKTAEQTLEVYHSLMV